MSTSQPEPRLEQTLVPIGLTNEQTNSFSSFWGPFKFDPHILNCPRSEVGEIEFPELCEYEQTMPDSTVETRTGTMMCTYSVVESFEVRAAILDGVRWESVCAHVSTKVDEDSRECGPCTSVVLDF